MKTKNILDYYQLDCVEILDQHIPKKTEICKNQLTERKSEYIEYLTKCCEYYSQYSGFTLTLKTKYHDDDPVWLHRHIHNTILKSRIWKGKIFCLRPEFTKKGVLHYHGIIFDEYQTTVLQLLNWWRRNYGFVKPELKIRHNKKWIEYMFKDYFSTGLWTIETLPRKPSGQ